MSFAPADRVRFETTRRDLAEGARILDLGILGRKVTVQLVPESGPEQVEFNFQDSSPEPGINPYWLKVVQSDMEMAWSSPVFVDYAPPTGR
jgi:hypothetical protein